MTQYWVIRAGERRGPYEESDILEGVELGTVRPNDLLWVDGMRAGVPIAEVIANLGKAPPSRPPLTLEPLTLAASAERSPYRPPSARVDDLAELALGNVTYAGFWVRFAAAVLDTLVVGLIGAGLGAAIGLAGVALGAPVRGNELWLNLLGFALSWLYFAGLESGPRCAGYGKRAFRLQVLRAGDLTRISFPRATGRWLGRFLSTLLLLIGYLMQPFTPRRQTLHDYLAGTVVIAQAAYSRTLVALVIVLAIGVPVVIGAVIGAGIAALGTAGR